MQPYANRGGNSSVVAFEIGEDAITIQFQGGSTYLYDYSLPGTAHVEQMKALAIQGMGLSSYVNRHVRKAYAARLR